MTLTAPPEGRPLPPVISRLLRGTFWLALRTPLQAVFGLWAIPLIVGSLDGKNLYGAYLFAWGYGFLQFLLEFGMSSAMQKEVSACWTRGDREGVDRAVACGLNFYAVAALIQAAVLLAIAYFGIPSKFNAPAHSLIFKLLWLQALTAPCFGISTVLSAVLQAARRYEILPKFEFAIVILRFAILAIGLNAGFSLFSVVVAQTLVGIGLSLGPAWWVMTKELAYTPPLRGARLSDYWSLLHISTFMFLMQLSVVLADRIDTAILGYALQENPAEGITLYGVISKPFLQLRQTGWMLAYFVMPAMASLVVAKDHHEIDRIKYDGTRLLVAMILPIGLLAAIYAHPFLEVWMTAFAPQYRLMQLFLIGALPLVLAVLVQMAIGVGAIKVVAIAALAGSLVNLPISYYLTLKLGVVGVIWGTVLTTLISNLLIPGIHVFRVLDVKPSVFLRRSLGPPLLGAASMIVAVFALQSVWSAEPQPGSIVSRAGPLIAHLTVGMLAYFAGYLILREGRGDGGVLWKRISRRSPKTSSPDEVTQP